MAGGARVVTSRWGLLLGAGALAGVVARPRLRNWGATIDDCTRLLPGDRLVAGERGVCTMAIDISAAPATVSPWFDVARAEPDRSVVLRAALDLRGRPYDPAAPRPRGFVDARWEFFLDRLPDGTTRLLARSGSAGGPRWLTDVLDLALVHPAHVVMQVRQPRQLRARAESPSPHPSEGAACPPASPSMASAA